MLKSLAKIIPFFFAVLITDTGSNYAQAQTEPDETIEQIE